MPVRTPKYRLHKGSGQALVQIDGRRIYLGRYGTEESKERYRRILLEHLRAGPTVVPANQDRRGVCELTINEVIVRYWSFVEAYYVKNGRPTDEQAGIRIALRLLQRLFGSCPANDFGASSLKTVRQAMLEAGHSRTYINKNVNRIRRMFKWATSEELVQSTVLWSLQSVVGLRAGRSIAREPEPVRPVPYEHVDAVKPYVSRQVWAMVELQRLTGMRSGEVTIMRGRDLDTTGRLWLYRPASHKTDHHGHERVVELGPRAQAAIRPFLNADTEAFLFSPAAAAVERHARQRRERKTPVQPSQRQRSEAARRRIKRKQPGSHYSSQSYGRAIKYVCQRAGVPHWHPHQLRHSFATRMRKEYGLEVARVLLGHRSVTVSELYAEQDRSVAAKVMAEVG